MAHATATTRAASGDGLRALIVPLMHETGGPVTALRAIQDRQGWIDGAAIEAVADVFNLSRADVRGLVEFYADFKTMPPATHVVAVCQAEACQAAGSRALTKALEDRLDVKLGHMDKDHDVELEPVYCLGLCARAPALMIDGTLVVEADEAIEHVVRQVRP
jgi:formate dehydrogenase subunit gamma